MKFKPADVSPPDLDMTPMIDIVFQLITFFMVINKFDQAEADERVTLPKDQLAVPPAVQRKNSLLLNFGYVRDQTGQWFALAFVRNLNSTRPSEPTWPKLW